MSTKGVQEQILATMKRWQKIEDASVASTAQIMAETENPVVREITEIIQRDSQNHRRVQQLIIDSMGSAALTLTPDDLEKVWDRVEKHIQIEKDTAELAEESLAAIKGKTMALQQYLLQYLVQDEQKHNAMLNALENVKKGMYPYGG